jgi:hypothetical protein
MVIHVPTQKADVAVTKFLLLLKAKPTIKDETAPLFLNRYLFIQQENTLVDVNSRL